MIFSFIETFIILHIRRFVSDETRQRMQSEFLDDPTYNYEAVNRASKACGPLVKWAIAQVQSCNIVSTV